MERRKRENVGEGGSAELNRQLERLQRDLGRRERELEEERRETEKTIDRMRVLEKDKIELKRELDEVRDEVTEYQRLLDEMQQDQANTKAQHKGEDEDGRLANLRATLQERNREIEQFILDLEKLETEKDILKEKLKEVSSSLEEGTLQLTEMIKEKTDLQTKLAKTEALVGKLEEENSILQIRERELLEFKASHDQQLENLGNAVDIRVDVWKKMMFQKDEEIERLHSKVEALLNQPPKVTQDSEGFQRLKLKLKEREDQIHLLTQQLQEATAELNQNAKTIENLQAHPPHSGSGEEVDRALRLYEKKLKKLESKVEKRGLALSVAEKEAEEKTKEVVVLSARLREYEEGQYGLSDAVTEIKELKSQIRLRDRDLEKYTQEINQFQIEGSELLEENEMLRKKLGHSIEEDLSQERKIFTKKRDQDLNALRTKVEVMENEITTLKTRNYELKKQLTAAQEFKHSSPIKEPSKAPEEIIQPPPQHQVEIVEKSLDDDWREKYEIILHENTELRRGLQEILDSLYRLGENDSCNVRIESPILENLLREMSARGLINYPYAISSFHLKVCNLEGKNAQLREELHRTRIWAEGLIEKEKKHCDEWRGKAIAAQEMSKTADGGGKVAELTQLLKESQLETGRWRRIAEQTEKLNALLNEKVEESEIKLAGLEARLEQTPTSLNRTASITKKEPEPLVFDSVGTQTEIPESVTENEANTKETDFEERLRELENLLAAKDQVIENLQTLPPLYYDTKPIRSKSPIPNFEMEEGLQLARETIHNLTNRLRTKEENLLAYKRLLSEVRGEMQMATERHVQEMNALQSTIHQQQQAFTRMKSTLSHPVRDTQTSDIEGIIREQLTRINELEECVRDLEHTMGNVASQLAAARSDAHRWRTTAETYRKEIDLLHEQATTGNGNEIESLRERLRLQEEKISELKRCGQTVPLLKEALEEKEMEIQALRASSTNSRPSIQKVLTTAEKPSVEKEKHEELDRLRKSNRELQSKLSKLQLRISKMNATNRASGMSQEMEELRKQYDAAVEERDTLRNQLNQMEMKAREDDEKKRKTIEGFARWEESKKWKKTVNRLEEQKQEIETERNKMSKQLDGLRLLVVRLEKEKALLEARLKRSVKSTSQSDLSLFREGTTVDRLRQENEELRGLIDQKELSASEEVERLSMETRILRERIQTQERQLTAYEVSQKGDPRVVAEIEKLVQNGDRLQQELVRMEQDNLNLKLQVQEMKLETPRLRDRVQHLQKLVDVLKTDKSESQRGTSGRSLGELERTITALKSIIDKLQKERKKPTLQRSKSALSLRERQEGLIEQKQLLMDKIHEMEEELKEARRIQLELEAKIEELLRQRDESTSRAQSAEMRLKTFLDQDGGQNSSERYKALEQELERKSHLLNQAKKSLEQLTKSKMSSRN